MLIRNSRDFVRKSLIKKFFLPCLLILAATASYSDSLPAKSRGTICFVVYAPKIEQPDVERKAIVLVDNLPEQPLIGQNPRVIANALKLSQSHSIQVKMQDEISFSQRFKFKTGVTMMNFWRSAGYWHLEPNTSGECKPFSEGSSGQ